MSDQGEQGRPGVTNEDKERPGTTVGDQGRPWVPKEDKERPGTTVGDQM